MAAVKTIPPPGLEVPCSLSKDAMDQLVFQCTYEVPSLRQHIAELTSQMAEVMSKVAELEMKLQTSSSDQHHVLQRKSIDEKPQMRVCPLEQKTSDAKAPIIVTCNVPPCVMFTEGDIPQGFDADGLKFSEGGWQGTETMKVDWNIRSLPTKLKSAMGRPLVSSPFNLWGLEEVRLMVAPLMQGSTAGPRSRKEKEEFSKMVTTGPLYASLMLKVPNARPCSLKYYLGVGKEKIGPHTCDFSNTAIDNRGSFGINWLSEINKDSSITVSVEMLPPPSATMAEEAHQGVSLPPGLTLPVKVTRDVNGTSMDETLARRTESCMSERRISRTAALADLSKFCQAEVNLDDVEDVCATKRRQWLKEGTLADRPRADGGIGLAEHDEQMVSLYLYTLPRIAICQEWRKWTQWSDDRTTHQHVGFDSMTNWINCLDQALSLLPVLKTDAWRVARGFRHDDLTTKFERGTTIKWYEPKSVTMSQDVARQWAGQNDEVSTVFEILEFQGHDISFLSSCPGEQEAMIRAVSTFEVIDTQLADLASDDPLMRCDRVTLKQMQMQGRAPTDCCEFSSSQAA
jgi:hypothetical protein